MPSSSYYLQLHCFTEPLSRADFEHRFGIRQAMVNIVSIGKFKLQKLEYREFVFSVVSKTGNKVTGFDATSS